MSHIAVLLRGEIRIVEEATREEQRRIRMRHRGLLPFNCHRSHSDEPLFQLDDWADTSVPDRYPKRVVSVSLLRCGGKTLKTT